jgi:glutathione S-transferase
MSAKYKLYGHPVSPFSYLAHGTLVYKKVDFEFSYVDLSAGEQKTSSYLAMNPYGQVPLLVTPEDYNIYESWSIFEYLEEAHQERNLLPKKQPALAKTRSVAFSLITGVIPAARELFMNALGRITLSAEAKETVMQNLKDKLTIFEKEFLSLDKETELSPIDLVFYQAWNNLCFSLASLKTDFPKLESYHQNLAQNQYIKQIEQDPAVAKVREFFKGLVPQKV